MAVDGIEPTETTTEPPAGTGDEMDEGAMLLSILFGQLIGEQTMFDIIQQQKESYKEI